MLYVVVLSCVAGGDVIGCQAINKPRPHHRARELNALNLNNARTNRAPKNTRTEHALQFTARAAGFQTTCWRSALHACWCVCAVGADVIGCQAICKPRPLIKEINARTFCLVFFVFTKPQ